VRVAHIAGATWADYLFVIGLAAIGTALILGVGMRVAAGARAARIYRSGRAEGHKSRSPQAHSGRPAPLVL